LPIAVQQLLVQLATSAIRHPRQNDKAKEQEWTNGLLTSLQMQTTNASCHPSQQILSMNWAAIFYFEF